MSGLEPLCFKAKQCFLHAYPLLINLKRYGSDIPYPSLIHFGILFFGQMEILRKYFGVDDTRIDKPTSVQKFVADNGPPAALAEMG